MENINFGEFLGSAFVIIMFLAGVVTTIGGAISVLKKWWNETRTKKHSEILELHTSQLKDHEERLFKLETRTSEQDGFIAVICQSMLALLDHNINGDSIDKLKHARDEMEMFLVRQNINKEE